MLTSHATATSSTVTLPTTQTRTLFDWLRPKRKDVKDVQSSTPKAPQKPAVDIDKVAKKAKGPVLVRGDLASSSIFEDEAISGPKPKTRGVTAEARNPHTMSAALDPNPMARLRWERKMVIRDIQNRGRLTKAQVLKKTEIGRAHV